MNQLDDVRNYNCGQSDYAKHRFQAWEFWIKYKINNGFDCDLVKRTLRSKQTDPRVLDYKKMIHICLERIRQIQNNENVFPIEYFEPQGITLEEMIADYDITENDKFILYRILYPTSNRIEDYKQIIDICNTRIRELEA